MAAQNHARGILGGERLVALDVGAAHGLLPHWATLDRVAEFYLFEPNPDSAAELRRIYARPGAAGSFKVVEEALSGSSGPRTLHVTNASTGASLLRLNRPLVIQYAAESDLFPIKEVSLSTRTLREVLDELKEPRSDMIKLDIQGAELEVLRGLGKERLATVLAVELEVGMPGGYLDQPTLFDVDEFLEGYGLSLTDLRPQRVYRTRNGKASGYQTEVFGVYPSSPTISGRIWEVDAVYFRKPETLVEARDAGALRRLIVILCAYNYFADAYFWIEQAEAAGLFTARDADELKANIRGWHRRLCYRFFYSDSPALGIVRKLLHKISSRSAPRWAQYMTHDYPSG